MNDDNRTPRDAMGRPIDWYQAPLEQATRTSWAATTAAVCVAAVAVGAFVAVVWQIAPR